MKAEVLAKYNVPGRQGGLHDRFFASNTRGDDDVTNNSVD